MDKINQLKAEIFDIIRQQDRLKITFSQLERNKQNKLKELEGLESKTGKGNGPK